MATATATATAAATATDTDTPLSPQQLEGAEGAIIYWSKRGLKWKSTRTTTTKNATKA